MEIIDHAIGLSRDRYEKFKKLEGQAFQKNRLTLLDSIAVRLIVVGEKIKTIEQKQPGFWGQNGIESGPIIRTRDFLSHHYEDVDFDAIVLICENHLPDLAQKIKAILAKM